jgi:hypothetical protein
MLSFYIRGQKYSYASTRHLVELSQQKLRDLIEMTGTILTSFRFVAVSKEDIECSRIAKLMARTN